MSDIVAQLEVLSRESGCLIDLSAIIDLSICPKIDLKTHKKPHKIEEKEDVICVTPTESHKPTKPHYKEKREAEKHEEREIQKRCDKGNCFEVREDVCKKNHVALDLEILCLLGLLSEEDLEKYLKTTGEMNEDDHIDLEDDDVALDPLLSLGVGDNDDILDLEVGGDKGLLNLDLLGREGLLNIGGNGNGNGKGNNGKGNNGKGNNGKGNNGKGNNGGYLSHYQPLCNKGFKKPHSDHAKKCHAKDVNHCLAICHSQSALLTIQADAKVGDIANIQLCAAIEFNSSEGGDNCRYFVAPETEPCHDEQLEENEHCTTFVRN